MSRELKRASGQGAIRQLRPRWHDASRECAWGSLLVRRPPNIANAPLTMPLLYSSALCYANPLASPANKLTFDGSNGSGDGT